MSGKVAEVSVCVEPRWLTIRFMIIIARLTWWTITMGTTNAVIRDLEDSLRSLRDEQKYHVRNGDEDAAVTRGREIAIIEQCINDLRLA